MPPSKLTVTVLSSRPRLAVRLAAKTVVLLVRVQVLLMLLLLLLILTVTVTVTVTPLMIWRRFGGLART